MRKIISFITFVFLGSTLLLQPLTALAVDIPSTTISSDISVEQQSEKVLKIHNSSDGTTDLIEYINENNTIVTEDDGTIHNITFDDKGSAYDNGILVSEYTEIEGIKDTTEIQSRGVNGPWRAAGTRYTKRSFYSTSQSVAISIVGFVPGFGYIAGAAAIVHAVWAYNQKEIYFKISYFIDNSNVWQKSNCSAYRYSNYTGLLSTTYGTANRIHW